MRWSRSALPLALLAQGCALDYDGLATSEAASGAATTASSSGSSSTAAGTTSGSSQTTTGPGGGEGGAPAGPGSGGAGGSTGGGGEGGTLPCCVDATDCDDDNPCTDDACTTDTCCSNQVVEDGALGADDPTDCIVKTCVAGEPVEEEDDDDDPPDTAPPCDVTICVDGARKRMLAELGTSCGDDPLECDGEGVCEGCDADPADQCGVATACATPACIVATQVCDPGFTTADPADPTPGDCLALDCTGDLADPAVVPSDTDVPTPLACSLRACLDGEITTPVLAKGEPCLDDAVGVCDGVGTDLQACVTCRDTEDGGAIDAGCADGTPICDEAGNSDLGQCIVCVDDLQGDGQDSGCDVGDVCDGGACVNCYRQGNGVSIGCGSQVCNVAQDTCVNCFNDGNGEEDPGCATPTPACTAAASCVECQHDNDCSVFNRPNGERCNRNSGTSCGCTGNGDCNTSSQGTICRTNGGLNRCGCGGDGDCDHDGSAGGNCSGGTCGN